MKSIQAQNLAMERSIPAESDVEAKLRGMLLIRLLFSAGFFLLGPLFFRSHALTLYWFTGILFSLTLLYTALLKWRFDRRLFANIQIFVDVLLVTFLVALTGWENSKFGFLYIIPITTTCLFFQLRESISVALLSSILYASVVLFHRHHLLPENRGSGVELFYTLYIRTIIFCMVGFLCGHLANMLKRQREELTELKSLRDLILSSMNSGLITTDANNTIIYANRAAELILGLPLTKIYNHNLTEFFTGGQNTSLDETLDRAMSRQADDETPKPELEARTARGRRIPIGITLSAMTNRSGEPMGKVMVFSDLTKVKELERRLRAIEKFRTAGELAAGIAHEIRNPLTAITGSIEMLSEAPELSQSNRELLSVTLKESGRLNAIIEDFLAYAKRGNLDMRKEDLSQIIKQSVEMLHRGGKVSAGVHINLVAPTRPVVVSADRALMAQVFLNLLSNAVDAVDGAGTISIIIEAAPGCDRGARRLEETAPGTAESPPARFSAGTPKRRLCSVTITDTGPGISQENLGMLFEPFFTTKKNGVGIGLCIAEKIVREHNGYIDITSEEGHGASVTVVIPKEQSVGEAREGAAPPFEHEHAGVALPSDEPAAQPLREVAGWPG
ncbi:PAS domain S-box protein [bacterium]|nr:PAS domain S-box protein [bacterium]